MTLRTKVQEATGPRPSGRAPGWLRGRGESVGVFPANRQPVGLARPVWPVAAGGESLEHDIEWDYAKEVKVKIPVGYHVKLHSVKVLTGKAISDAVTEALDLYFAAHPLEQAMVDAGFARDEELGGRGPGG